MKWFVLVFALFLAGCIDSQPGCIDPYTLHMGECCLDENADGICDSDKPICKRPYMEFENSCCLDMNMNMICDDHEPSTTKPTTSTTLPTTSLSTSTSSTVTTSTVAKKIECLRLEDCETFNNVTCDSLGREVYIAITPIICTEGECVYRSSKEISAYPCLSDYVCVNGQGCIKTTDVTMTTTTLLYRYDFTNILDRIEERASQTTTTTTTTLPDCVDSDMGREYNVFAENVSGVFLYNGTVVNIQEYCADNKNLVEYYCESSYLKSRKYECPNSCGKGRCCVSNNNKCLSNKDCCSGRCKTIGLTSYCL